MIDIWILVKFNFLLVKIERLFPWVLNFISSVPEAEAALFEDTEGSACAEIESDEHDYLRNEEFRDKVAVVFERVAFTIIYEFIVSTSFTFITVTVSACNDQNTEVENDTAGITVEADQEGRIGQTHASAAGHKTEEEVDKAVQFVDGCPLGIETIISINPAHSTVVVIADVSAKDLAVPIISSFPKHEEVGAKGKSNDERRCCQQGTNHSSWAAVGACLSPVKVAWSAATKMF